MLIQLDFQVGFETWLSDSLTEVDNFEIIWLESKPVPSWLSVSLDLPLSVVMIG